MKVFRYFWKQRHFLLETKNRKRANLSGNKAMWLLWSRYRYELDMQQICSFMVKTLSRCNNHFKPQHFLMESCIQKVRISFMIRAINMNLIRFSFLAAHFSLCSVFCETLSPCLSLPSPLYLQLASTLSFHLLVIIQFFVTFVYEYTCVSCFSFSPEYATFLIKRESNMRCSIDHLKFKFWICLDHNKKNSHQWQLKYGIEICSRYSGGLYLTK